MLFHSSSTVSASKILPRLLRSCRLCPPLLGPLGPFVQIGNATTIAGEAPNAAAPKPPMPPPHCRVAPALTSAITYSHTFLDAAGAAKLCSTTPFGGGEER